jgi:hypothetical protein
VFGMSLSFWDLLGSDDLHAPFVEDLAHSSAESLGHLFSRSFHTSSGMIHTHRLLREHVLFRPPLSC